MPFLTNSNSRDRGRSVRRQIGTQVFAVIALWITASSIARSGESLRSLWIVSNGFHTSLGFRARDLPFVREISCERRADYVLIGWGAKEFYEGNVNPWTFVEALTGIGGSILHVVPVREPIARRFSRSEVIKIQLPEQNVLRLIQVIDDAFARNAVHHRIFIKRGYYADSRFYAGVERFYFPKMCNVWVAEKLHGAGARICVANSLMAFELLWQVEKLGKREQWLGRPRDAF